MDRGVQRKGFSQAGCSHQSESLSLAIHQATGSQRLRFCESDRCEAAGMSASRNGCKLEAVGEQKNEAYRNPRPPGLISMRSSARPDSVLPDHTPKDAER